MRWVRRPRLDVDEIDLNEALDLTGADVSNLHLEQELTVPVVRIRADGFTCSRSSSILSLYLPAVTVARVL